MERPTTLSQDVQMAKKNIGLRLIFEEQVDLLLLCPNFASKKAGSSVQSSNQDKNLATWKDLCPKTR